MTLFLPGRIWKKLSLATRIMLISSTMLLATVVIYFSFVLHNEVAFYQANLLQNLNYELEFLTPLITEPILVGDYKGIQQIFATRVQQPNIQQITWTDNHGYRLESTAPDEALGAPAWFMRWMDFPHFRRMSSIRIGGESYGTIEVRLSAIPTANKLWRGARNRLTVLLLDIVILCGLIGAILTNGLRPLYALKAAAIKFGQGEHSLRMTASGPPEMLACIHAFNSMAGNIERLFGSLRDSGSRNRLLAIIVEQSNVPIVTKDLNGLVTSWNTAATAMYGYSAEEMLGKTSSMLHLPGMDKEFEEAILRVNSAQSSAFETKRIAKDGSILDISLSVSPLYDEENRHIGEIAVTRDITRQKRAEEALSKEKERAQVTLASIADAVITTDIQGNVDYLNPVAEKLLGWRSEETYGYALNDIFHSLNEAGATLKSPVDQVLNDGHAAEVRGDAILISRNNVRFPIEHSAAPIYNHEGQIIGVVLVFRDVSASRNMALQLSWQASHDALTALANRREFEQRLDLLIETAHSNMRKHALLYMDLDQFKIVNDTCGHVAGDELLRQLSAILNSKVRGSDTIARLGGDEFGVLLADCPLEKAMEVAETLRQTVSDFRFIWQDKTFVIGVSIGVVAIAGDREGNSDIMGIADAACYAAKDKGRNQVQASPNDRELSQRRGEMLWVSRINNAFEENRFRLHYQRIVSIQQGEQQASHYEALLRMLDQDGNLVPPMMFIPAAERYNLMRTLDRKVICMAFEECEKRAAGGRPEHSMTISINLSGDSLSDALFLDFLKKQFATYRVNPYEICFEVTETAAIANMTQALLLIRELKEMGCRFSLDDFGSGLSSFGYLKNLPVDYLKIDGSFVRDMAHDPIDAAMVGAIHNIGHVMGIKTIAEWVENDETLEILKQIGVDYAQGYLFERPKPMEEILLGLQREPAGRAHPLS